MAEIANKMVAKLKSGFIVAEAEAAAGAKLAGMKAAFDSAPAQVIERETAALDRLLNDPAHIDRKIRGDIRAAHDEAAARSRISAARRDAENQPVVSSPASELEQFARHDLTQRGMSPQAQNNVMSGKAPTPQKLANALAAKSRALADPDWVAKWQSGAMVQKHDMDDWNSVIANAPVELRDVVLNAEREMYFRTRMG